jgi:hypothetical protein
MTTAPPEYVFEFRRVISEAGEVGAELWRNSERVSTPLFDHPALQVGYRYLDVFHLAHAVVLHWSPNTQEFLRGDDSPLCRQAKTDHGIEDTVSVLTFTYATFQHSDLAHNGILDTDLVTQIQILALGHVDQFTPPDWEHAAWEGIAAWRRLLAGDSLVQLDFSRRRLYVSALSETPASLSAPTAPRRSIQIRSSRRWRR